MAKDKALIYELGHSMSFGRLSLLGKVLWPMLLIKADDQGRGLAEPDWIKWRVCTNVKELTLDNIPDVLAEMASERIGLLHLYEDSRGRRLFQIIRWWEPSLGSGSTRQWAAPSEFEPPEGWTDRIRVNQAQALGGYTTNNWDSCGGFNGDRPQEPDDIPTEVGTKVGTPTATPTGDDTDCNGMDCNGREGKGKSAAGAASPAGDSRLTFQEWESALRESKNKAAVLRSMFETLYPGRDPPSYSYLGRAARKVSGAGRLAHLLWQHSVRPPTGDVLAYCMGHAKNKDGETRQPRELQPHE